MVWDIEKLLVTLNRLGEVWGRTRLQKMIFLLKEKDGVNFGYDFIPYHYGPYSQELQVELNLLEAAGLVQVKPEDKNLYVYSLTEEGKNVARKIEQKMDRTELEKLVNGLRYYKKKKTRFLIKMAKELVGMSA